eukprot:5280894-Pyramimonas_sp.AAC.3
MSVGARHSAGNTLRKSATAHLNVHLGFNTPKLDAPRNAHKEQQVVLQLNQLPRSLRIGVA